MQKGKSKEEIIRRSRPAAHEQGDAGIAKDQIVLEALRSAYRHIERLNQIVLVEKDERRVAELRMMSAERTKEQLKSEVAKLEHWVRALDQKLASAEAGRDRLAVEAAELRASDRQWARQVLGLESRLRQSLRKARQPWWMRLFAKR